MNDNFVVVDGSNIATEGRSTPSLSQLDEGVREFQQQFPDKQVIVVVDATFGHRIDTVERTQFDEAVSNGEVVSPPAGAIGRGDAFLLRVAERVGGQVLSNDSFQEFHGEHPWLFEEGRLIGGTPVPGVGWIFTPRSPVRGPRSRVARAAAERSPSSSGGADASAASRRSMNSEGAIEAAKTVKAVKTKKAAKTAKTAPKAAKTKETAKTKKAVKVPDKAVKVPDKKVPDKKTAKASAAKRSTTQKAPSKKAGKVAKKAKSVKKVATSAPAPVEKRPSRTKTAKQPAKSAKSSKASKSAKATKASSRAMGVTKARRGSTPEVGSAIQVAIEEVLVPADPPFGARKSRRHSGPPPAVNDPLTFLTFVSDHPIGKRVTGIVSSFTSHGAMVDVGNMHCYVPLTGLSDPPPATAKDLLTRGERRDFMLVALDPPRRGAELALPEVVTPGRGTKRGGRRGPDNLAGSASAR